MICHSESSASYATFAKKCKAAGLGKLFGDDRTLFDGLPPLFDGDPPSMFCDRAPAMNAFFDVFKGLTRIFCVWHLIRNIRAHLLKKNGGNLQDNDIWRIQGVLNEDEYEAAMKALGDKNKLAEVYLRKVDKSRWVGYAVYEKYGVYTYMNRTNGCVESINGKYTKYRFHNPFRLALNIIEKECAGLIAMQDANDKMKGDELLTTWTNSLICGSTTTDGQLDLVGYLGHRVNGSSGYTLFKGDKNTWRSVDLTKKVPCNCGHFEAYKLHCRHAFAFLRATNQLENFSDYVEKWVPRRHHLTVYKEAYKEAWVKPVNPTELRPKFLAAPVFIPHPNSVVSVLPLQTTTTTSTTTSTTSTTRTNPVIPQILPNDEPKKKGRKSSKRIANAGSLKSDGGKTVKKKKIRLNNSPIMTMTTSGGLKPVPGYNPNYPGARKGRGENRNIEYPML